MTAYFPVSLREYDRLKRENDLIEREENMENRPFKTQDEIVSELRNEHGAFSDFFGTKSSDALEFLDFDHAKEFLKPEATAGEWQSIVKPISRERLLKCITDYMPFAFEKANNCRGLSANRSIYHMEAWLWILNDGTLEEIEDIEYQHYGKEKLIAICEKFGIDHSKLDDGVLTNTDY